MEKADEELNNNIAKVSKTLDGIDEVMKQCVGIFSNIAAPHIYNYHPQMLQGPYPVDTRRKLNVHKPFRRRPGRLLNVLCTFNFKSCVYGVIIFRTIKIDNSVLGQYLIVPFL